ncbi:hypothetical protein [Streptomyces sp. NPDC090798]|uniref:hypothetical protein n=1 Tax=Streptomyces sp. NPDC090798 TaxID=3365968 RepID=UPI0037F7EE83
MVITPGSTTASWSSGESSRTRAPSPAVAPEDPCAIRRRAIATLAAHGVAATVVGDAGYLEGVLDVARTGQGVALLAAVEPALTGSPGTTGCPRSPPSP